MRKPDENRTQHLNDAPGGAAGSTRENGPPRLRFQRSHEFFRVSSIMLGFEPLLTATKSPSGKIAFHTFLVQLMPTMAMLSPLL